MKPLLLSAATGRLSIVAVLLFLVWALTSCMPTVTVTEIRPDGSKTITETKGGVDGQAFATGAALAGQIIAEK
jgi:hypothetical protein